MAVSTLVSRSGGSKLRVGLEGELLHRPAARRGRTRKLVEECRGQHAQNLHGARRIAVLALLAVLLQAGVGQQRVQACLFLLLVGRAQRLVVDGEQAGHIAVARLHNLLGRGESWAGLVQPVAHGMASGSGPGPPAPRWQGRAAPAPGLARASGFAPRSAPARGDRRTQSGRSKEAGCALGVFYRWPVASARCLAFVPR